MYPDLEVQLAMGERAVDAEQAKVLLGWEEETEENRFGDDYLFADTLGSKIKCHNNIRNRPLYMGNVEQLKQDMLQRRWQFNGEPILIGKTGLILNGQHQLIALVLAEQERVGRNYEHWSEKWGGPVQIDKLVVCGIEETDEVFETMDTCKPRTVADLLYRSPHFENLTPRHRKASARVLDYAIRLLWQRTGVSQGPFVSKRTHSEALDFLARHPRLIECVGQVLRLNEGNAISRYLGLGYAAGLLYLMGSAASDGDFYRNREAPSEKDLDWGAWGKAVEYWTLFANQELADLHEVRYSLGSLYDKDVNGEEGPSLAEKLAIVCRGWVLYQAHGHVSKEGLDLHYTVDRRGIQHMTSNPCVGGIDLGCKPRRRADEDEDPDLEELERRKAEVRQARAAAL